MGGRRPPFFVCEDPRGEDVPRAARRKLANNDGAL